MRITGNWIGHHGAWPTAAARETKIPTQVIDERADWRDRLPFWTGFAVLATAIVGIDLLIVWSAVPH